MPPVLEHEWMALNKVFKPLYSPNFYLSHIGDDGWRLVVGYSGFSKRLGTVLQ